MSSDSDSDAIVASNMRRKKKVPQIVDSDSEEDNDSNLTNDSEQDDDESDDENSTSERSNSEIDSANVSRNSNADESSQKLTSESSDDNDDSGSDEENGTPHNKSERLSTSSIKHRSFNKSRSNERSSNSHQNIDSDSDDDAIHSGNDAENDTPHNKSERLSTSSIKHRSFNKSRSNERSSNSYQDIDSDSDNDAMANTLNKTDHRSKNQTVESSFDNTTKSRSNEIDESVIAETDDESDIDEKIENSVCYSPRTRRSIGLRVPARTNVDYESDDSIIFEDDENKTDSATGSTDSLKRDRSLTVNDSITTRTPNAKKRQSHPEDEAFNESEVIDGTDSDPSAHSTMHNSNDDIEFSNEETKTSGIQVDIDESHESKSPLEKSVVLIDDSSDEKNDVEFKSSTPIRNKGNLVQPKINLNSVKNENFVSQQFYDKNVDELVALKKDLGDNRDLLERMADILPDKGRNLKIRINKLETDVEKKDAMIKRFIIEEDHPEAAAAAYSNAQNNQDVKHNWRDAIDQIKPVHTGEQGMSTFNNQKALTLNRIEKMHKAMDSCPADNELAEQPDKLKIALMPHQLYALNWMHWREVQKPKGGILADDMGLGKTLSVISLVLDAKYKKSEAQDEEESSESDDDMPRRNKFKTNHGGTLIVCPASLINQWEHEVNNRVRRNRLSVLMHHGNNRTESPRMLAKDDLVITTYGVVSSEEKSNGALFKVKWHRIVLDEAHMIRNHNTAIAKACCELRSTVRWGLTGTPIQNKHMDVYSMLKFLRVTPFDDLPTFKKFMNPNTPDGLERLHNVLKPMLLRRTKSQLQTKGELEALPEKVITTEWVTMNRDEANVYAKVLTYSQTLFAQYMEQHKSLGTNEKRTLPADIKKRLEQIHRVGRGQEVKSTHILVLLLRLRQICDHPGLIDEMLQDECGLEDIEDAEEDGSMNMNLIKQMIGLKVDDDEGNATQNGQSSNLLDRSNEIFDLKTPSSKCKKAVKIVKQIMDETNDKVVVVSQWKTVLDVVAEFLHRAKVHYVELNGKTPIKDRNNIVVNFNKPSTSERVMMLSLVAGGVGLNLTGANHLLLLDPHWNPQLESQAFDRIYRVGQQKPVKIYKLLCENTVEKRIQSIQEHKLELAENVLTGSCKNVGSKLSFQDLRTLFEM